MHVDGFRFDLAAALARELHDVDRLSAFFDLVQQDPVVSQVKLIAEPWDVGEGGYQVGKFPPLWAEWNGTYRDTVRDFWRGKPATLPEFGSRLTGSSDLYETSARRPGRVGQLRHLPRRLHAGRPGQLRPQAQRGERRAQPRRQRRQPVLELRRRGPDGRSGHQRASAGPAGAELPGHAVLLAGRADAARWRRDGPAPSSGNNNAYCQDNELSWVDWEAAGKHAGPARVHLRAVRAAARRTRCSGAAGSSAGSPRRAARRPAGHHLADPVGRQMTDRDWQAGYARSLAVFLNGARSPSRAARRDRCGTTTSCCCSTPTASRCSFTLPGAGFAPGWELVVDTACRPDAPQLGRGRRGLPGASRARGLTSGELTGPLDHGACAGRGPLVLPGG